MDGTSGQDNFSPVPAELKVKRANKKKDSRTQQGRCHERLPQTMYACTDGGCSL